MTEHNHIATIVPIGKVYVPAGWNSRQEAADVGELAQDIAAHGLLQPPIVTPIEEVRGELRGDKINGASFVLVAGFRRMAALRSLDFRDIPVIVVAGEKMAELRALNLRENIHRKELHPVDLCEAIVTYKVSNKMSRVEDIKAGLGVEWSVEWLRKLLKVGENLLPEIRTAWRKNPGVLTMDRAISLATHPHDDQRAAWESYQQTGEEPTESEGGGDGEGSGTPRNEHRRPSKKKLEKLADLLQSKQALEQFPKFNADWVKGARTALRFALGRSQFPRSEADKAKEKEDLPEEVEA